MNSIVRYLSKPNHEVRDTCGRFEGTFRWRWLASLWATLHPERPMHLVAGQVPGSEVAALPAGSIVRTESRDQVERPDIRRAPARRPRRRPTVQRAA
jgi:hypothetical protein